MNSRIFIKATEGTLIVDPTYAKHRAELESAGVLWGAYHFFGHRTPGKEQARNFIKTARLKRGNILPVLDIEWHRFMKDPKRSAREAKNFCREIKHYYGVNPIIYCSTNFYEKYLADCGSQITGSVPPCGGSSGSTPIRTGFRASRARLTATYFQAVPKSLKS